MYGASTRPADLVMLAPPADQGSSAPPGGTAVPPGLLPATRLSRPFRRPFTEPLLSSPFGIFIPLRLRRHTRHHATARVPFATGRPWRCNPAPPALSSPGPSGFNDPAAPVALRAAAQPGAVGAARTRPRPPEIR